MEGTAGPRGRGAEGLVEQGVWSWQRGGRGRGVSPDCDARSQERQPANRGAGGPVNTKLTTETHHRPCQLLKG